jgi:pimeloyl-ACP methyl ester carboxylesterase
VLVVHGTADALVPAWNSRRLAARLPGARLVELGVCGHMPMEEAPDRFLDALADFIADLD